MYVNWMCHSVFRLCSGISTSNALRLVYVWCVIYMVMFTYIFQLFSCCYWRYFDVAELWDHAGTCIFKCCTFYFLLCIGYMIL